MNNITMRRSSNEVTRTERRWVLIFSICVLTATTVPYFLGYAFEGNTWRFSGFVFGVEDGNSYIAKMLIGASGGWLFRTPYTAYDQSGVIAFLPYILLGKLSAPPGQHEQLVAIFHMFRIGAGILAILASYDLISYYIKDIWKRKFALILVVLGGGLGWLFVLLGKSQWLGSLPLDLYSPETFGFLGIYGVPHLSLARAGLLWGLLSYVRAIEGDKLIRTKQTYLLGAWWLLVAVAQPLTAVVMGAVLGLQLISSGIKYLVFHREVGTLAFQKWLVNARVVTLAGLIPFPLILYTYLAFSLDPFLREWTSQNIITSPHPLHYLIAYGLVIPVVIVGSKSLLADKRTTGMMLVTWVLALPLLAYAPYNLQRRLPEGIWVALVILAVAGLERTVRNWRNVWRYVLLLALPSTLILLIGGILAVRDPAQPVFRPTKEVEAFEFIAEQVNNRDTVLTAYSSGNALPAWAPVQVIIGHGPESIHLEELMPEIRNYYRSDTELEEKQQLLEQFRIDYVFWGPEERQLGDWNPEESQDFDKVFDNGEYLVFKVMKDHP